MRSSAGCAIRHNSTQQHVRHGTTARATRILVARHAHDREAMSRQRVLCRDKFLAVASWALFELLFMNIVHRLSKKKLNLVQWDP